MFVGKKKPNWIQISASLPLIFCSLMTIFFPFHWSMLLLIWFNNLTFFPSWLISHPKRKPKYFMAFPFLNHLKHLSFPHKYVLSKGVIHNAIELWKFSFVLEVILNNFNLICIILSKFYLFSTKNKIVLCTNIWDLILEPFGSMSPWIPWV